MERLENKLVEKLGVDTKIKIESIRKVEERMCYDAWWEFKTNLGDFKLKTYDGISEDEMKNKCKNIETIEELNNIQPKYFYYD
jgi:hypothetical protein